jgi:hypothetical protein
MLSRSVFFFILSTTLAAAQPVASELVAAEAPVSSTRSHYLIVPTARAEQKSRPPIRFDVSRIGHRQIDHGMNLYSQRDEQLLGDRLANLIE